MRALFAACVGALFVATAAAQGSYPKSAVKVIVPFPAGGGVDAAARLLAQRLAESFGQSFVVENRGGANGNIGTEAVAHAPADGYTLLATGAGFATNPSLYRQVPYDPIKDFEPIALMALGPNILVAHPSLPVKSVQDVIELARAKPDMIGFAGSGNGSTPHLAGELFNQLARVRLVHIPYRGSGPAMIGLLSGEVPLMFLPAINARQHVAAGKLRAIAVTSKERLDSFPDLPTLAEAGLAGYESSQWYGWFAPTGTPRDVLASLNGRIASIMRTPEMRKRMHDDGLVPAGGTREQFAEHLRAELARWGKVIAASGARVD